MKLVDVLRRTRYFAPILIVSVVAAVGLVWPATALRKEQKKTEFLSRSDIQRRLHAQIRDGVGKEVKFAGKGATAEEVRGSVETTADFIRERSGLELSAGVKEKLARLESEHLSGKGRPIGTTDLADILTDTAAERLSSVTDAEIEQAAATLTQDNDEVILRGNGRGRATASEFIEQSKTMRAMSLQGDSFLRDAVRKEVEAEVTERVNMLSRALPEQFGEAGKKGVTPLQAVLVTYSVVSDDPLAGSKDSLKNKVEKAHQTAKSLGLARSETEPAKAYGKKGAIFATPADLVLNDGTLTRLLDRVEERSAK